MVTIASKPKRRARQHSTSRKSNATFMRNDASLFLASWQPALREASEDVRQPYKRLGSFEVDDHLDLRGLLDPFESMFCSTSRD